MPSPKLPSSIYIGHIRYTVKEDEALLDRASVEGQRKLNGYSYDSDQLIALRPGMAEDYRADTLLHEVLHQCLRVAGCDPNTDAAHGVKDIEERTVLAVSGTLLSVLRRNPLLVKYLCGG